MFDDILGPRVNKVRYDGAKKAYDEENGKTPKYDSEQLPG